MNRSSIFIISEQRTKTEDFRGNTSDSDVTRVGETRGDNALQKVRFLPSCFVDTNDCNLYVS